MSVALDPPSQLIFKRPLTQPIEEILYVKNIGNEPLAFKVKTTAPKKYCVRPNSSIIEPGSHVEVQIVFQPFREEPPPDYKCKDKFLVQTAVVKPEWLEWNMIELWNHIETEYKDTISQNKVKCVFLPPELPQPYLNDESLEDNPPTPTLSHVPSVMETVKDDVPARQSSPPPSPTLVSTLPAIIDAARRASASQPPRINTNTNSQLFNDANTSSVSLSSHYTSRQTPSLLNNNNNTATTTNGSVSTLPNNNNNSNNNNNNNNITTLSQESYTPSTLVISLEKTIQEQQTQINNLENEKKLLDQQIVDYRLKQTTLQQQLNKQEKDILTVTTLKDQLKQTIQTLEEENRKQQQEIIQLKKQPIENKSSSSSSSTTVAAHAMQTSSLPTEGYPPQVLLSVSILVFILTYLFF